MTGAGGWCGSFAVLADPHVHDVASGSAYGLREPSFIRSLSDTAASTRIYNEATAAFRQALGLVAERGIPLVLIPGDLTDDGQRPNWRAATDRLRPARQFTSTLPNARWG